MRIHPFILLFLCLINIATILIVGPSPLTAALLILHFCLSLISGVKSKKLIILLGVVLLFGLSILALNYFYTTKDQAIINSKKYNYIKIQNMEYRDFVDLLKILQADSTNTYHRQEPLIVA